MQNGHMSAQQDPHMPHGPISLPRSRSTHHLGEHYGEEETGVLQSHTGQEHCLSKLAYSRAFTNLARYSGDEKMQRFRA
jgi:hypothetical protein